MVFSSIVFVLYFLPVFLVLYFIIDRRYKNVLILVSSILFYAWGAPKFIFVILGTTLLDFILVHYMDRMDTDWKRKVMLSISIVVNLGLLVYFKYSNFFIENINLFLSGLGFNEVAWTKLVLPIGISFYTFETITYVVDVYRRIHRPLTNFWDYQLYIILFPKLIAGPIVRYHEIADQITDRSANENNENRLTGFYRFVIGLSKKVLIANQMGAQADMIFSQDYHQLSMMHAWVGILAYTFQIYFDFSGYSDMAIGIGRMMGFRLPENFNSPYTSGSITEFWRRWHITLGKWMRNYLYIPLGGNRISSGRTYMNLWLVFVASGLWHGASWNFVIWGAYHGCFLVLERTFLLRLYNRIGRVVPIVLTFFFVVIGWVFFRVEHFNDALTYISRLFAGGMEQFSLPNGRFIAIFLIAVFFAFFAVAQRTYAFQQKVFEQNYSLRGHLLMTPVILILFVLSLASITSFGFNPFIYFRF
ncbi:MAG: MBOAT family protein [Saprospiraceae bacterium]|nr:MBOAT family protein [Saprospiraceae bacterium]MBX7178977.1 MBOAT family protein [Saprospiraceae bacterium]MCB0590753.1 MBOAT family protein [Saprospiraceae bacterium]MCO5284670.1 MBOAT family protein [Saprospiraceae bacterium]MCO6471828.1 MBOAT family protein [Saprospiraceae bacterium]